MDDHKTVATVAGASGSLGAPFDVEAIRADFPILYREVYGKPLVYLDNAASAQKPRSVIEAMDHVNRFEYANVHRGLHYLSNTTTQRFEDARESVRRFLNAESVDEIIFTRNATSAINLVADSFGADFGEGDEIVLSIMEHHSNIVPWHFHRERKGAVLKWAPITDNGEFQLAEFEKLLTPRTKIVAITQMSNVTGTLVPIREVIRLAHDRGIPVLVDGSQSAVHMPIDVRALDADFYVFTGHKTYGPSGIGVLFGKRALLEKMRPYEGGGGMIEHVSVDRITYGKPPHRFEAGTPPIVEAIGLGAALNYMMQVGRDNIANHEAELRSYAHARLADLPWLKIYGNAPGKGAIISFTMDGLHAHDIATIIDRSGVAVRAGHHCAQPLLERLGVTAVARASFAMYNTKQDVDAFVAALERAHELFV
ncbi:aminotransferase class V-fold PLP-dependent enzyme [Hyphomicrobium sulfonivorans]|uniref:aminotransferase class V-fold PLP-dependent enzyme n=1 Tax=Hyphomicrobium sulfonivorans TaxID=121290 RepID=UPI0018E14653|nr:cysteine desulfurase [Hyphomicrobium sulfonivorans]MBI1650025.1 cysteine desulfurase [Hyphomicrobium sulfonivorans]NSL72944.1 cysteine desulfurase [Hyphomicrobium sulfonivorans]